MSQVSAPYILTCIQRPPLYKGHYEGALAWPLNTGFTVHESVKLNSYVHTEMVP